MENPFDPGYYNSAELRQFGFKSVGENVLIAKNCTIIGLHNIAIGDDVRIDSGTNIIATGPVDLGSFIHIGGGCHLAARGGLRMGDYSGLSQGVKIYTASDDYSGKHLTNPTVPTEYLGCKVQAVELGRHVIIGAGSVILPGCSIGEGSSVGALSLVTKRLPEWSMFFGVPAKLLRPRKRDLLALEAMHRKCVLSIAA
jgi:galactoside O-acetyltransferase